VVLLGEPAGDAPQFWAQGRDVSLPHSGIRLAPVIGFHDWGQGCAGVDHCYWAAEVFAQTGVSLDPETVVPLSFEACVAGRDPILWTALDLEK